MTKSECLLKELSCVARTNSEKPDLKGNALKTDLQLTMSDGALECPESLLNAYIGLFNT